MSKSGGATHEVKQFDPSPNIEAQRWFLESSNSDQTKTMLWAYEGYGIAKV